jgi:hypothetical protein
MDEKAKPTVKKSKMDEIAKFRWRHYMEMDVKHFLSKIFTPKVLEAIFQAFLKFWLAIVDAKFVQKISNFLWTWRTKFYKIPMFCLGVMPQKQNSFVLRVAQAAKKLFVL